MKIQFLLVPYDSGRREWRMGRGPSYLLRHGVGSSIRALGHEVDAEYVEPGGVQAPNPPASTEIATSFSLYREVAERARTARENGALPIILGGKGELDPAEDDLLRESELLVARGAAGHPTRLAEQIGDGLEELSRRVSRLHVHLDADVIDEGEGRANAFAAPFGLTSAELREIARLAASRFEIV